MTYVTCEACSQEMTPGTGCTAQVYALVGGRTVQRVPYTALNCHDCGVSAGQYHHPGCDMERCPTCAGQAISCGCPRQEDTS